MAFRQTVLTKAPEELVKSILSEERLTVERHGWHAALSGRIKVALALLPDRVVLVGVRLDVLDGLVVV